jgi:hypothetical protein
MASKSKPPSAADYNEVHIAPMVKSEDRVKFDPNSPAAVEASLSSDLKTHTRPLRVDVDLVLVPVTVRSPGWRKTTSSCWIMARSRPSRTSPVKTRRSLWVSSLT